MDISKQHSNPYAAIIDSPVGCLGIKIQQDKLTAIEFLNSKTAKIAPKSPLAKKIVSELNSYFKNPDFSFTVPLDITQGSPFQKRVWKALQSISTGKTVTYGGLAKTIKSHARAIGSACRTNPIPLIIPCHRVVGIAGLGGYLGDIHGTNLSTKAWLLKHEGVSIA